MENLADVLLLRREDGSVAAGFGAKVTPSEVAWTAEEDRRTHTNNTA